MNLPLFITRLRFTAILESDLRLPTYAGSLLRGVFGAALRRSACMTAQPVCADCPLWRTCPYPAVFETPPQPTQFVQNFTQVPNPYVIEPPSPLPLQANGWLRAGESLVWHMVLIGESTQHQLPLIVHAWQRALRHGLGPLRVPGVLESVECVSPAQVREPILDPDSGRVMLPNEWATLSFPPDLVGGQGVASTSPDTVTLHFYTPLRLQHQGQPLGPDRLDARTLLSQMLRRTNLMLDLHLGIRPVPFDAPALLAAVVPTLTDDRRDLHWRDWPRYSGRQKQEMNLGGVMGAWTLWADPQALAPFLPWLWLGQWLHLGKNATMGLGGYRLVLGPVPAPAPATAH